MAIDLNRPLAWRRAAPAEQALLNDLQGNILKSHGRPYAAHMFLQFANEGREEIRAFVRSLSAELPSAAQQLREAEAFRQTRSSQGPFSAFLLSADGYRALGIPESDLPGDAGSAFRLGMKARREALRDPAIDAWDAPFQQAVHAMYLVAGDAEEVNRECAKTLARLPAQIRLLCIERGRVYKNANEDGIEHFGYVDGRSQPLLLIEDLERERTAAGGTSVWDPAVPLSHVLVPCPGGVPGVSFGSFLVFRKLEQNVRGFKEREEELADRLGLTGEDRERAGALVIGRFEDGTPITLQPEDGLHHPVPNDFTFADDPAGRKCPFQAHIRKANPRGDTVRRHGAPPECERSHLLVRRGIPYGDRKVDEKTSEFTDSPPGGVGLLFMNYQRSIENQFEFAQQAMANAPDFPVPQTGIDPITGQGTGPVPRWPVEWDGESTQPFDFAGFVTLRGGEYLFAPSLSFLREL